MKSNRFLSLLFFVFTIWIVVVCGAKSSKKKTASTPKEPKEKVQRERESFTPKETTKSSSDVEKKMQTLRDKINKNGVVSMTDDNFQRFAIDRPRDYHAILMFTATDPKYQCGVCGRALSLFEDVAKSYNAQYNFTTATTENRIAFFRIEVDDARNIFGQLGLDSVPRFYALPPMQKDSPKLKIDSLEIESQAFHQGLSQAIEHISGVTKVKIQILHDPTLVLVAAGLIALFTALFVTYAHRNLAQTCLFYQNPYMWMVFSIILFAVGVSGSIFCVIRSAPPLGYGIRGKVGIFAPQGRDQYAIEGVIVALITVGCGVSYYLMGWASRISRFPIFRHVAVLFFLTTFVVLSLQLWNAYTMKTMWYNLKDTFPEPVWTWLTGSVKKQSGLVKRLFRVSEIWLTSNDDSAFFKKFESLVLDYVKRTFLPGFFKTVE